MALDCTWTGVIRCQGQGHITIESFQLVGDSVLTPPL